MKEKANKCDLYDVTIRQLRVLSAIAGAGTIRGAANDLGVTPPAVTQQLDLLERSAGLALFERSRRGLRLTDAGQHMLAVHTKVETALSDGSATFRELKGLGRGRLVIGAISTAKYLAPRLIVAFAKSHPRLEVQLKIGNREEIIAALDQLDIAIMGTPPASQEVERMVIGAHPHIIIGPLDHPLARQKRITYAQLATDAFLVREMGSGTRMLMERTFAKINFTPRSMTEFGSNETIKQAVMAGLGIAFISAHTVAAEVSAGWLSVLPVDGLPVVREWYAVRARERQPSPASAAMWQFVADEGAGFLPEISSLPKVSQRSGRKKKE